MDKGFLGGYWGLVGKEINIKSIDKPDLSKIEKSSVVRTITIDPLSVDWKEVGKGEKFSVEYDRAALKRRDAKRDHDEKLAFLIKEALKRMLGIKEVPDSVFKEEAFRVIRRELESGVVAVFYEYRGVLILEVHPMECVQLGSYDFELRSYYRFLIDEDYHEKHKSNYEVF